MKNQKTPMPKSAKSAKCPDTVLKTEFSNGMPVKVVIRGEKKMKLSGTTKQKVKNILEDVGISELRINVFFELIERACKIPLAGRDEIHRAKKLIMKLKKTADTDPENSERFGQLFFTHTLGELTRRGDISEGSAVGLLKAFSRCENLFGNTLEAALEQTGQPTKHPDADRDKVLFSKILRAFEKSCGNAKTTPAESSRSGTAGTFQRVVKELAKDFSFTPPNDVKRWMNEVRKEYPADGFEIKRPLFQWTKPPLKNGDAMTNKSKHA